MEQFGERLKQLRLLQKMSLEELALAIGKTGKNVRSLISNWESGRAQPSMTDLTRLSEVLGVSLDELILGKPMIIESKKEGYITISVEEYIDLQRKVIKHQDEQIKNLKQDS